MRAVHPSRERTDSYRPKGKKTGAIRSFRQVGRILGCSGEQIRKEDDQIRAKMLEALRADPVLQEWARACGLLPE